RLPTDRRRNASERRVDESSDGADGRPTIKTRDRLLKRLIAVHGEPRFDLFNSRRPSVRSWTARSSRAQCTRARAQDRPSSGSPLTPPPSPHIGCASNGSGAVARAIGLKEQMFGAEQLPDKARRD